MIYVPYSARRWLRFQWGRLTKLPWVPAFFRSSCSLNPHTRRLWILLQQTHNLHYLRLCIFTCRAWSTDLVVINLMICRMVSCSREFKSPSFIRSLASFCPAQVMTLCHTFARHVRRCLIGARHRCLLTGRGTRPATCRRLLASSAT